MTKIYDCFTLFNEIDLLELRLEILNDLVDHFVIVESNKTFTHIDKPFNFENNHSRFVKYEAKIIYVKVEDMPPPPANDWAREAFQRNAIMRGITNASPNDLILVSDLDEIPDPLDLKTAINDKNVLSKISCFRPTAYMYYLNIRTAISYRLNTGPRLIARKHLKSPEILRMTKLVPSKSLGDGFLNTLYTQFKVFRKFKKILSITDYGKNGWHFTYMGGLQKVKEKLNAFSHQEEAIQVLKQKINALENTPKIFLLDSLALTLASDDELPRPLIANKDKWAHMFIDNLDEINSANP